ncbi:MAG: Imm63 family immunity protein [Bacteroidota bacterium]
MSFLTLKEIESKVSEVAKKINAPEIYLPTYGFSEDGARPHIEVTNYGYYFVVVERGKEYERRLTFDFKELLYWIFKGVVSEMAGHWEVHHRNENEDSRRQMFAKEIQLISKIDVEFGKRLQLEIDEILRRNPFVDK